jgi:tetratricopeptide (TPR) repeat protein
LAVKVKADPQDVGATIALAEARSETGDKSAARQTLSKFLKTKEDTRVLLALDLLTEKPEAREEISRRVLALDPSSPEAHFRLGCALSLEGRHGEAVEAFRQHVTMSHASPTGWWLLAQGLAQMGERDQAVVALETSLEQSIISSGDAITPQYWEQFASLYEDDPMWGEAAKRFRSRIAQPAARPGAAVPQQSPPSKTPGQLPQPFDERPFMGLEFRPSSKTVRAIVYVALGATADAAGVRTTDILVEIEGHGVVSREEAEKAIAGLHPGDSAHVVVLREGISTRLVGQVKTKGESILAGHARLKQGADSVKENHFADAEAAYGDALRGLLDNREATSQFFWSAYRAGHYAHMEQVARIWIAANPHDAGIQCFLSLALRGARKWQEAATPLDLARHECPESGLLEAIKGIEAFDGGNRPVAEASFERALCLGKGYWAIADLATALDAQERARRSKREADRKALNDAFLALLAGNLGGTSSLATGNGSKGYDPNAPQYQASYYGAQQPLASYSQQTMANMMWTH